MTPSDPKTDIKPKPLLVEEEVGLPDLDSLDAFIDTDGPETIGLDVSTGLDDDYMPAIGGDEDDSWLRQSEPPPDLDIGQLVQEGQENGFLAAGSTTGIEGEEFEIKIRDLAHGEDGGAEGFADEELLAVSAGSDDDTVEFEAMPTTSGPQLEDDGLPDLDAIELPDALERLALLRCLPSEVQITSRQLEGLARHNARHPKGIALCTSEGGLIIDQGGNFTADSSIPTSAFAYANEELWLATSSGPVRASDPSAPAGGARGLAHPGFFHSEGHLFFCTERGNLFTYDGAQRWAGPMPLSEVTSIASDGTRTLVAWGGGELALSPDGGGSWDMMRSPVDGVPLLAVHKTVIAVAMPDEGAIHLSMDRGRRFYPISSMKAAIALSLRSEDNVTVLYVVMRSSDGLVLVRDDLAGDAAVVCDLPASQGAKLLGFRGPDSPIVVILDGSVHVVRVERGMA